MKRRIITNNESRIIGKKVAPKVKPKPVPAQPASIEEKANPLNPQPLLGGQAITSNSYAPWKPGNVPTAADMQHMLDLLGGGPVKGGADTYMTSPETYKKLQNEFGATGIGITASGGAGIKMQVVPGLPENKIVGINQSTVTKLRDDYFTRSSQQYLNEWFPWMNDGKKEKENK